jgi:hypothetical protein
MPSLERRSRYRKIRIAAAARITVKTTAVAAFILALLLFEDSFEFPAIFPSFGFGIKRHGICVPGHSRAGVFPTEAKQTLPNNYIILDQKNIAIN